MAREIALNVARHYREMSQGDDYGTPEVDWDSYLSVSFAGLCWVVTARDKAVLVGYSIFIIGNNPRHKNLIEANNGGFFVEKPYRGKLGRLLTKKSDEYLQAMGVHETHYTESDDRVGRMLPGYQSKYRIWSKKYGK